MNSNVKLKSFPMPRPKHKVVAAVHDALGAMRYFEGQTYVIVDVLDDDAVKLRLNLHAIKGDQQYFDAEAFDNKELTIRFVDFKAPDRKHYRVEWYTRPLMNDDRCVKFVDDLSLPLFLGSVISSLDFDRAWRDTVDFVSELEAEWA